MTGIGGNTWTGRCQHWKNFSVLVLFLEPLHKLSLTLQEAEGPTEARVKHMMNT